MLIVEYVFLALSLIVTFLFFLYGFNTYYLLRSSAKYKVPKLMGNSAEERPTVAIHLPIYNENYVVHRLVAACTAIAEKYGKEKVRIMILDDSDDETIHTVDQVANEFRDRGYQLAVIRRGTRRGYKAGALQYALERTDEEYVVVFDADFIPPADFLDRTIGYFNQDDRLGIVQTRWEHINRNYSLITRAIATGIDVHFLIEQAGRFAAGVFQNFNGSGGVIRKQALLDAGGWQSDTLAEDLDASYRIQMQGYKFIYLKETLTPGEIPPTVPSFKKQQERWACGSLRTARKLLPSILSDTKLGFKKRLEAFIHLTGYIVHPMMFMSFLIACFTTLFNIDIYRVSRLFPTSNPGLNINTITIFFTHPAALIWGVLTVAIGLCTIAVWIPPIMVLKDQVLPFWRKLLNVLVLFLLGFGLSLANTIEAGKALLTNRDWAFIRTPKYAIQKNSGEWKTKRYQIKLGVDWFLELLAVALGGLAIADAIRYSNFGELVYLIPFTSAFLFVSLLTIIQSRKTSQA